MIVDSASDGDYVQFGCGFSPANGWLNYDSSPTLKIERSLFRHFLSAKISGNDARFPDQVKFGDIRKGLPVPPKSVRGVYASHVLEHLSLCDMRRALRNTLVILRPGGVFRMVVPDLQARAERYITQLQTDPSSASIEFMRSLGMGVEERPHNVVGILRTIWGGSAHLWMWDRSSLEEELKRAGFVEIRTCKYGDAEDPMFLRVEDRWRFFDRQLGIVECAIEARRALDS